MIRFSASSFCRLFVVDPPCLMQFGHVAHTRRTKMECQEGRIENHLGEGYLFRRGHRHARTRNGNACSTNNGSNYFPKNSNAHRLERGLEYAFVTGSIAQNFFCVPAKASDRPSEKGIKSSGCIRPRYLSDGFAHVSVSVPKPFVRRRISED